MPPQAPSLRLEDARQLDRALALARRSIGLSDPNPRVGCVLADSAGDVLAEGWTQQAGGPHAEAHALARAAASGARIRLNGGTAWVSLEPCSHHGRTPPCADALIAAGLARVVVALGDPFAQVAGRGLQRLRDAGIEVVVAPQASDQAREAFEINIGFFSRVLRGRPWVRLKLASSLDGRTALADGRSQWITGPAARADGHRFRARAGALLTGIGTVLADDPGLDVRDPPCAQPPRRLVMDSRFRMPIAARMLGTPGALQVIGAVDAQGEASARRAQALNEHGVETVLLPGTRPTPANLLAWLATQPPVNELHVEAGAALAGAWLDGPWVDEVLLYQAPLLLGAGRPLADVAAPPAALALSDLPRWHRHDVTPLGPDLRQRLRRDPGLPSWWLDRPHHA